MKKKINTYKDIENKRNYILKVIIILAVIIVITNICFTIFLTQKVEYSCNSGEIDLDLLVNNTGGEIEFSHFQLNKIDGLNCKGKFPLGLIPPLK